MVRRCIKDSGESETQPRKRKKTISKTKKRKRSSSSSRSSSSASKFFSDIVNDDILLEILGRLPNGRSVLQRGLVCKRWHSLVYNSQFIERFIHHHHQNNSSLPFTFLFQRVTGIDNKNLCYFDSELGQLVSKKSSVFHEKPLGFVKAAFNDLLLVRHFRNFYVCNPITRQYIRLPNRPQNQVNGYGLVCKPNRCNTHPRCTVNIEYRYRVVLIGGPTNNIVKIFCSETGKWRRLAISFANKQTKQFGCQPVVCNGILYWLDGSRKFHGIVAFDPFNDTEYGGHSLVLPTGVQDGCYVDKICFGACLGQLRFSHLRKINLGYFELRVWELNYDFDGYSSWHLVCKFRMERANTNKMIQLAFHPYNGNVIFLLSDNQFCRYEIETCKFEELGQWPNEIIIQKRGFQVSTYCLLHPPWPTPIATLPSFGY